MVRNVICVSVLSLAMLGATTHRADASSIVINLDSHLDDDGLRSVFAFLTVGTYTTAHDARGFAAQARFKAWSFSEFTVKPGLDKSFIWFARDIGFGGVFNGPRDATEFPAVTGGTITAPLTLTHAADVGFGLNDCPVCLHDTQGGVSFPVSEPEPVPEPATIVLLGTGIAGLIARRARRKGSR